MAQSVQYTRHGSELTGTGTTIPRFFMDSVQDELASAEQGRPIFREIERVQILMPGNQFLAPVHNVNDEHRNRWSREYEAFRKGIEIAVDGTPLEQWNMLNKAQVYELKGMHLRTVEDVARMPDAVVQQIPFGQRIREAAAAYLDDAAASALTSKLSAENERLIGDVGLLKRQLEETKAQLDALYTQFNAARNAPHPMASMVPAMSDPMEAARMGAPLASQPSSSLDSFSIRRKPGRPPRVREEPEAA